MQNEKKKTKPVLLGTLIVLFIIFMYTSISGGGEENNRERNNAIGQGALEQALTQIEGVGSVTLYFHYGGQSNSSPLADYFSLSSTTSEKDGELIGVLVVAEGAGDPKIKNELSKLLAAVLQLPEHRIVIMKKKGEHE